MAGRFYPRDPADLRAAVQNLLHEVPPYRGPAPKALIVPHAGYLYSGPVAASAYARLAPGRATLRRVVLVGPAHFTTFDGVAASSAAGFATPLGAVPLARDAIAEACALPGVRVLDSAHSTEHSLEVQLPFLQTVLDDFTLVPLLAGPAAADTVHRVLDQLWGGPETCIVITSDLSHYLDSETARALDRSTANSIENLEPAALTENRACGRIPICGLLPAVREHHLRLRAVDLRNSGDTAGPTDRVVGYGAFVTAPR
jgi:AmmeMemoRadiSam system protein B